MHKHKVEHKETVNDMKQPYYLIQASTKTETSNYPNHELELIFYYRLLTLLQAIKNLKKAYNTGCFIDKQTNRKRG